jgi:hypothetical protein
VEISDGAVTKCCHESCVKWSIRVNPLSNRKPRQESLMHVTIFLKFSYFISIIFLSINHLCISLRFCDSAGIVTRLQVRRLRNRCSIPDKCKVFSSSPHAQNDPGVTESPTRMVPWNFSLE